MDHLRVDMEVKFASDKTGVFSGYGGVTGNKDYGGDVIASGAFKNTLREWEDKGKLPPMLLQHGGGFLGGAMDQLPVGKYTSMEENSKGLKLEGELFAMNTERGQYIYEGMKSGTLDGLSIGYRVKEFVLGTKPTEPRRTIKSLDLVEVSIVTFPMNDRARIGAVKSAGEIKTIREFEDFLRDVGGYSAARAKQIAGHGFKSIEAMRDAGDGQDVGASFDRLINTLTNRKAS